MLTDPVVTPKDNLYQAIFGFLIALISTLLDMFYGFRVQHLFMAVFILSPFITILNYSKTKKDIYISITIMIFVFITITVIQYQPPFYFEMEG
jgi:low affinity Fe/Cu permease